MIRHRIAHQTTGRLAAFTVAAVTALVTALGSTSAWVVHLLHASGIRVGIWAWVRGSISRLMPPPVVDGGFAVVDVVVSPTECTVTSNSLLAGGSIQVWTGSATLGCREYSRVGNTVYCDTTGMAHGHVLYDPSLDVTSLAAAVALLTALGSSFVDSVSVKNRTTGALVVELGYSSALIVPRGDIDTTAITDSQYGIAASAAGAAVELASAAAWTPTSGTLRAYDSTGELGDSAYTRSTTTLTVTGALATAVAAAIAAGRTVYLWDTDTELSVGSAAAGRDVRIVALPPPVFDAAGLTTAGQALLYLGAWWVAAAGWHARLTISYTRSAEADGQYMYAGVWLSATKHHVGGVRRLAGADVVGGNTGTVATPSALPTSAGGSYPITRLDLKTDAEAGTEYTLCTCDPARRRNYVAANLGAAPEGVLLVAHAAGAESVSVSVSRVSVN